MKKFSKIFILLSILLSLFLVFHFDLQRYLSLSFLKENIDNLREYYLKNVIEMTALYFIVYVVVIALSIPGAAVLTLAGGAIFGLAKGTLIVSFASTIGATLAFLVARFLLKDAITSKYSHKIKPFEEGFKKEGPYYLLILRLTPIFPFFIINILMALTPISAVLFYLISQVGMLPGTMLYVNAGEQLATLSSLKGILSPQIILSLTLLGVFPLIAKKMIDMFSAKRLYKRFKKPKKFDYNMVVIGGGAGGLVTSYICSAVKAKVALIEKEHMGGECLNKGCVPSKAIIHAAKQIHETREAKKFGLLVDTKNLNFSKVRDYIKKVIKKIEPHDSTKRYESLGVECIKGDAKLVSPWEVKVNGKILTTKNITIATGAIPFVPPIPGIDTIKYYTSDTIWDLEKLPEKLLVIGGGPIGCELAQSFARLGSKVCILEILEQILLPEDKNVSDLLKQYIQSENLEIKTGVSIQNLALKEKNKTLVTYTNKEQKTLKVEFDEVLICTGKKANLEGSGFSELKIETTKNGKIKSNLHMQTNYPNIYACGDVTTNYQFTHNAAYQAWFCAVNALFGSFKKFKFDATYLPWCTYTDPEVASIGLNEKTAKSQNISYDLYEYDMSELDRAIIEDSDKGFVRILTKKDSDKIIGATIMGKNAGEIIHEIILAMKYNLGLSKILETIHIYPTISEANKYVAGIWKKQTVSEKTLELLKKFHIWRRK